MKTLEKRDEPVSCCYAFSRPNGTKHLSRKLVPIVRNGAVHECNFRDLVSAGEFSVPYAKCHVTKATIMSSPPAILGSSMSVTPAA